MDKYSNHLILVSFWDSVSYEKQEEKIKAQMKKLAHYNQNVLGGENYSTIYYILSDSLITTAQIEQIHEALYIGLNMVRSKYGRIFKIKREDIEIIVKPSTSSEFEQNVLDIITIPNILGWDRAQILEDHAYTYQELEDIFTEIVFPNNI